MDPLRMLPDNAEIYRAFVPGFAVEQFPIHGVRGFLHFNVLNISAIVDQSGLGAGSEDEDSLLQDNPGMAALYASSIRGRVAVGSNTGYGVSRLGDQIDGDSLDVLQSPRCAMVNGFSVHALMSAFRHMIA